jgi:hypothetical protein
MLIETENQLQPSVRLTPDLDPRREKLDPTLMDSSVLVDGAMAVGVVMVEAVTVEVVGAVTEEGVVVTDPL